MKRKISIGGGAIGAVVLTAGIAMAAVTWQLRLAVLKDAKLDLTKMPV